MQTFTPFLSGLNKPAISRRMALACDGEHRPGAQASLTRLDIQDRNMLKEGHPESCSMLDNRHQRVLGRLRWLAELFDDRFRLPGTGSRFGLDGLLGLIPGMGDVTTALVSLYLAAEGLRLGMPKRSILRMGVNIILDMVLGAVPLIGDLFDFAWRANQKNVRLVLDHARQEQATADRRSGPLAESLS